MENLNTEIKEKILDYLKEKRIGASSSEISKKIGHNRITVTKYLEIMKAHRILDYEGIAQAKIWYVTKKNHKPTILIVDDELHIVDLVALCLIPEKYNILKASSGMEALGLVYKEVPDLIVLDLMMPGMNGYEVCQKLKENALTQHIPVIMLTAKGELEDKLQGLKFGADDYLVKPFDPMELEARVEGILRRSRNDIDTHPLTLLPGKKKIVEKLGYLIKTLKHTKRKFTIANIKIKNLDKFTESYSAKNKENVLMLLARIIKYKLKHEMNFFVGHTLNDNFIVISDSSNINDIKKEFGKMVNYLYKDVYNKDNMPLFSAKLLKSSEILRKDLNINDVLVILKLR